MTAPDQNNRWQPRSWRRRPAAQRVPYPNPKALEHAAGALAACPPLVSAEDAARLRTAISAVAEGRALLLQGGDCAENFGGPRCHTAMPTLRLLQELAYLLRQPGRHDVITVARMAGQFAKPRSSETETAGGVTLPSWRGDIVNAGGFDARSRAPNPRRMLDAYRDAASTLELIRHAAPSVFTSHEALLLDYEEALTRPDDTDGRFWCLSAHMVWIGDRTRQLDGAHVEYASGIANAIGVKCGPDLTPDALLRLIERLDPRDEPGRLVLIARLGADRVEALLPPLMRAVQAAGRRPAWVSDPMHGNTRRAGGRKVRALEAILAELRAFLAIASAEGARPGGVHLEMTGEDVLECEDGGRTPGIGPAYTTACDPRLNAGQAREVVQLLAAHFQADAHARRAA